MKQLISVGLGALVIAGYFLWESILFGAILWFVWNFLEVGVFLELNFMSYFQAVGILFVIKILRFDSAKLGAQQTIIIPKEKKP
jgi:hypothetical protein